MRECIYFISHDDGPIKIGKAKNVPSRLKTIQTGYPHRLSILGVMIGPAGTEFALHRKFADFRLNGEWFQRTPEIISFVEKHSMPGESGLWKNIENKTKVVTRKPSKQQVEAMKARIIRDVKAEYHKRLSTHIETVADWFYGLCHDVLEIQGKFNRCDNPTYGEVDNLRLDVRRALESFLGCDHRDAKCILYNADSVSKYWCDRAAKKILDPFGSDILQLEGTCNDSSETA